VLDAEAKVPQDALRLQSAISRQALINSNFDIWQRGTSFAADTTLTQYSADRWQIYSGNVNTTFSRQAASLNGSTYAMRSQRNNANASTSAFGIYQTLESADSMKLRGRKVTLSFYARAGANFSAASSQITVNLFSGTGTDQNTVSGFTGQAYVIVDVPTITTSWVKYTFTSSTVLADSINQLGLALVAIPTGTAGAADYFEITQVQVCAGEVALPFEPKTITQELADCQRYCFVPSDGAGVGVATSLAISNYGTGSGTTLVLAPISYPVPMRINPTLTATATDWVVADGSVLIDLTALSLSSTTTVQGVLLATVSSGITGFRPYLIAADASARRTAIFNSEL
jgi:hypothetical protein